jgi:hypothetical protein
LLIQSAHKIEARISSPLYGAGGKSVFENPIRFPFYLHIKKSISIAACVVTSERDAVRATNAAQSDPHGAAYELRWSHIAKSAGARRQGENYYDLDCSIRRKPVRLNQ